jgi:hypothetical protein
VIKRENNKYVLYSRDGKRKLFSSPSYQACLEREKQIEYFKAKAKEKK